MKKLINKQTLLKVLLIFCVGLFTRALFNTLFDINVSNEFLNGYSILYYLGLSGFVVFVNDHLNIDPQLIKPSLSVRSVVKAVSEFVSKIYNGNKLTINSGSDGYSDSRTASDKCVLFMDDQSKGSLSPQVGSITGSVNASVNASGTSSGNGSASGNVSRNPMSVSAILNPSAGSNNTLSPSPEAPITPAPITPAPITPAPITPAETPITPAEASSPDPLRDNPIDTSSFARLGESLEIRCRAIAATKPSTFSGNKSVSLRELGIKKNSTEFNMIKRAVDGHGFGGEINPSTTLAGKGWNRIIVYSEVNNREYIGSSSFGGGTKLLDVIKSFNEDSVNRNLILPVLPLVGKSPSPETKKKQKNVLYKVYIV